MEFQQIKKWNIKKTEIKNLKLEKIIRKKLVYDIYYKDKFECYGMYLNSVNTSIMDEDEVISYYRTKHKNILWTYEDHNKAVNDVSCYVTKENFDKQFTSENINKHVEKYYRKIASFYFNIENRYLLSKLKLKYLKK